MRVRIRFSKYGHMKFIGHLDVLTYFQRAFRRANLNLEYSDGFNPRIKMSIASPLGLGLTADNEYLDLHLTSFDNPQAILDRINQEMSEGFHIKEIVPLNEREEGKRKTTGMSLITEGDYLLSLKDGYNLTESNIDIQEFTSKFIEFYNNEEIKINKRTKKGERVVDIKPKINFVVFSEEDYKKQLIDREHSIDIHNDSRSEKYENAHRIYMQLSTGSVKNLKPELVMETFYDYIEEEYNSFAWQIHRLDLYLRDEENHKQISLSQSKI